MTNTNRIELFSKTIAKSIAKLRRLGMKAEADQMAAAAQATVERMRAA
jgi:hypothetical protein